MTKIVIFLQVGFWFCITVDTRYVDEELSWDGTMHRYVSGCTERFRDSVVLSAHLLPRLIILDSTNEEEWTLIFLLSPPSRPFEIRIRYSWYFNILMLTMSQWDFTIDDMVWLINKAKEVAWIEKAWSLCCENIPRTNERERTVPDLPDRWVRIDAHCVCSGAWSKVIWLVVSLRAALCTQLD